MSVRRSLTVAAVGFGLCALSFMICGLYVYWDSPEIINFLGAWIPFVLSLLLAFVPSSKEMKHVWVKWAWRSVVVAVGLFWSIMTWHQQTLSVAASARQTREAVGSAIMQANKHSDEKFRGMQSEVTKLGKSIDESIATQIGKSETDIRTSIGEVGKPPPPKRPKFEFSFWGEGLKESDFPVVATALSPDAKGNYDIAFAIKNDSSVAAQAVEEWVQVCDACSFAAEPKGFDHPSGSGPRVRHRRIGAMNPGVVIVEGNEIEVKAPTSHPDWGRFSIAFKVTCSTCGSVSVTKQFWITESSSP